MISGYGYVCVAVRGPGGLREPGNVRDRRGVRGWLNLGGSLAECLGAVIFSTLSEERPTSRAWSTMITRSGRLVGRAITLG